MKIQLMPVLLALVLVSASPLLAEKVAPTIPEVSRVKEIALHGNEMTLRIFKNGSGEVVYGANGESTAKLPQKTFSFEHVYDTLTPGLATYSGQTRLVGLPSPGEAYGSLYRYEFVKEQHIINKLLSDAGVKFIAER